MQYRSSTRTLSPRTPTTKSWPESLDAVTLDLAVASHRLRGLAVALEGRGDRGGAVAAEHIRELVMGTRSRLQSLQP